MKNTLTILLILSFCSFNYAQNKSINYKALIKDNSNNALSNQNITIEFSILEGPEIDFLDLVYAETHTTITDSNGIVIVNIGEGVPLSGFEGGYNNIEWGGFFGSHFLKVQIDSGSGLTDMGTTEFKAVPYALYAESTNSSGLEALDEGNGFGWRFIGKLADLYGPIGFGAVDLSYSSSTSTTKGATGRHALAAGYNTTASGWYSFASGVASQALESQSIAMGAGSIASAVSSVALGQNTKAEAPNSTTIGLYNIGGGDPLLVSSTDPLFEIGNGHYVDGLNDVRTNALTVLRNGTITAPSFDISEIIDAKALITKEYADANYSGGSGASTGLEAIDEGNGIGWRLIGSNPANYGTIGSSAIDLSISNSVSNTRGATAGGSVAIGYGTTASALYSTALGFSTEANGAYSIAFGSQSEANGGVSTAFGFGTIASGEWSTAMGYTSEASGDYSFVLGKDCSATMQGSIAIGINTIANANFATALGANTTASGIVSTAMGNYTTASGLYSTALGATTNANGDYSTAMGVGTTAQGQYSFSTGYLTNADGDYSSTFGNSTQANAENAIAMGLETQTITPNSLVIGKYNDNFGIDNILFQIGNGDSSLRGNAFEIGENGNGLIAGTLSNYSDKRLKTNITELNYGLSTILKLNPVSYNWKKYPEQTKKNLGLIAQEVQPIINEIITVGKDKDQTLSLSYTELIPVLIKAMQEQQEIINSQNKKINELSAQLNGMTALDDRVKQLETLNNIQQ